MPAISYMALSRQERAEVLFDALRKRQGQSFGVGVTRFERPLEFVGLSVCASGFIRDVLFEMHKVRNVYAHCGGRADHRFIVDCPWFGVKVGQVVPLTVTMFAGYLSVLSLYLLLLGQRAHARVGIRLVGESRAPHWDPQITVDASSREEESRQMISITPCIASLPVVQSRHQALLEST